MNLSEGPKFRYKLTEKRILRREVGSVLQRRVKAGPLLHSGLCTKSQWRTGLVLWCDAASVRAQRGVRSVLK